MKNNINHIMGTLYIIVGTCAILFFGMGIGLFMGQNLCDIGKLVQAPYFDDYTEIIKSKTIKPVIELDIEIPLDLEAELSGMTIPEQIQDINKFPTQERLEEIYDEIYYIAVEEEYLDWDYLLDLADCESDFRQYVLGDNNHSRGIYQIHDIHHPEVSDSCSFSIDCSTRWVIQRLKDGYDYEWACSAIIGDTF